MTQRATLLAAREMGDDADATYLLQVEHSVAEETLAVQEGLVSATVRGIGASTSVIFDFCCIHVVRTGNTQSTVRLLQVTECRAMVGEAHIDTPQLSSLADQLAAQATQLLGSSQRRRVLLDERGAYWHFKVPSFCAPACPCGFFAPKLCTCGCSFLVCANFKVLRVVWVY